MTTQTGRVIRYEIEPIGSNLAEDAAVGDTVLTLVSAVAFSLDGGTLMIDEDVLDYAGAESDDETGVQTVTLAAPLAVAYEVDLPVRAMLGTEVLTEHWAAVDLDDPDAEAIYALIPSPMLGHLSEGDIDPPIPVELTVVGDDIVVSRRLDGARTLDAPVQITDDTGSTVLLIGPQDDGSYGVQGVNGGTVLADAARPDAIDSAAIADQAVETRHIGDGQVDPLSLRVGGLGGSFSNLVQDPTFARDYFRTQLLAGAGNPADWAFQVATNEIPAATVFPPIGGFSNGWAAGAKFTGGFADWGDPLLRLAYYNPTAAVSPGDVLYTITAAVPGLTEGAICGVTVPNVRTIARQGGDPSADVEYLSYWTATVDLLDGTGTVLASASGDVFDRWVQFALPAAPVGVTQVKVTVALAKITQGDTTSSDPYTEVTYPFTFPDMGYGTSGDPNDSVLASDIASVPYFGKGYQPLALTEAGPGIAIGSQYLEWTTPAGASGTSVAQDEVLVTNTFPMDEFRATTLTALVCYTADYGLAVTGGLELVNYDIDGNEVPAELRSNVNALPPTGSWGWQSVPWDSGRGAVSAAVRFTVASAAPGAKIRLTLPHASVSGWYDALSGARAAVDERGVFFHSGIGTIFQLQPDYDNNGIVTYSRGYSTHTGPFVVLDDPDLSDSFGGDARIELQDAGGNVAFGAYPDGAAFGAGPRIKGIDFGTLTGTDAGGNFTVNHDLGVVPSVVIPSINTDPGGGAEHWHCSVSGLSATSFVIHVNDADGSNVAVAVKVHWLAIA